MKVGVLESTKAEKRFNCIKCSLYEHGLRIIVCCSHVSGKLVRVTYEFILLAILMLTGIMFNLSQLL
jgi:hypothetical protein